MPTKKEILEGVENVTSSKVIANNTVRYQIEGSEDTFIRLHRTDIVILHGDSATLNSGGYKTNTTKDRINNHAPCYVFQEKGIWYIGTSPNSRTKDYPFVDGVKVTFDGQIIYPDGQDPSKVADETKELTKKINKYCQKLAGLETLPEPSSGDCWHCLLRDENGQSMGEVFKDTSHLISHLDELYIHGSLLVNALLDAGYTQDQFPFIAGSRDTVVRAVRRYFKRQLGIAR